MSRAIKGVGAVLAVVLATGALAAPAAQSEEESSFTAADYPAAVDVDNQDIQMFKFPTLPSVTCEEASAGAVLKGEADRLTVSEPDYGTCHLITLGITFPITIDTEGCHLTFTADTFDPEAEEQFGLNTGDLHLDCAGNDEFILTLFTAKSEDHAEEDLRCAIHVPDQTAENAPVSYSNGEHGGGAAITADLNEIELTATVTSTSAVCPEESTAGLELDGSLWFTATDEEEGQIALDMPQGDGPHLAADFSAESYPATLDVSNEGEGLLAWSVPGIPTQTCGEVSASSVLKEEANEIGVEGLQLVTCHVVSLGVTFPVTFDTTDCYLTLTAETYEVAKTSGDGAATGEAHLEGCSNGGITVTVFKAGSSGHPEADLRCTIHIPNQTPVSDAGISYNNETAEEQMAVTMEAAGLGFETLVTESVICGSERTVTAEFAFSLWLQATDGSENYIDTTVTGTET